MTALPDLLTEARASEEGAKAMREAFTWAFATGYKYADETSRSCLSAMDDAWADYQAVRALDPAQIAGGGK